MDCFSSVRMHPQLHVCKNWFWMLTESEWLCFFMAAVVDGGMSAFIEGSCEFSIELDYRKACHGMKKHWTS